MPADDLPPRRFGQGRLRSVLDLIATVLVLVAASAVIALTVRNWRQASAQTTRQAPAPTPPKAPQPLDGAESVGSASAPLAMVIYSDFQCPYCAKFARETWPTIKKDFVDTGRVLVVFRHFPLPMHNEARGAALAATCAARQGKFWQVHDLLFQNQQQLSLQTERALALDVGVDGTQFDECMQHQPGSTGIARDMESAQSLGLNSTPTFLIGRIQADRTVKVSEIVLGAQPEDRFKVAFDKAAAIKPVANKGG
jgi:protein-disulfide isomerase